MIANEQGRREQLKRFGYAPANGQDRTLDPESQWTLLRSDFKVPGRPVPTFAELDPKTRFRAEAYIEHRARLDRLMDACDATHLRILREGPQPDLVEAYVVARDTYEDAVEDFGALRQLVQVALEVLGR